ATIGILAVQVLVCVAIILFFRKTKSGLNLWKTLIAPLISLLGLLGALGLVSANLSLLSGSESLIVASFPYLIALVGLLGAAFAVWLKSSRPTLYASLGKVFE
ncbi:MAG TPA: amino acid permease, partial [Rhizobium sp.]